MLQFQVMRIKNLQSFYLLVETLEKLPSIGRKSAEKMAYTLCVENKYLGMQIAKNIQNAIENVQKCSICGGLSQEEECQICQNQERNNGQLCIVGHPRDIAIIENTHSFFGKYFVLESLESVDFEALIALIVKNNIHEVIFSLSPSLANDALMLFIEDRLSAIPLTFSKIAQGVPTGIGLDHIDELSLTRAFEGRIKI
ncbi:recombination mediator RecR [Helicobacter cholecystus]|uniref:recombination mediator RecR n=1 Tax=Helicobacter cholecystus TaxID=45498 RepID=UPI003F74C0BA